jgi:anaerobic selenocysteine-containing dehydrogenase
MLIHPFDHNPLNRHPGTRKEYDRRVRTICQECSVGCGLLAYTKEGRIVDIQGDEDHPISRGRLCAKGTAFVQGLENPQRITRPATRRSLPAPLEALDDWEKALDLLTEHLRRISGRYGPRSLLIACDPEAGLDYFVGALRFARLWGTPYVFHPMNAPGDPSIPPGLKIPARPCSDWVNSHCLLLIEADLATTHPVAFSWVLDAQSRGAKIIAADTRFTATLSKADVALRIRPETGNLLGLALMKMMLEERLYASDSVKGGFLDAELWKASFESLSLEGVEPIIGLSPEKLREMSRLMGDRGPVTLITGKRLTDLSNYGIWHTMATAMGWLTDSGGGWYPLDFGVPGLNPYAGIDSQDSSEGPVELEGKQRVILKELAETAQGHDSPVKAIICSGDCLNGVLSPIRSLVKHMDKVVYFGAFPNATWQYAHLFFPATVWAEREGLCFNNDRAIQFAEKIVEPVKGCRSGLDFWMGLARRLGDVKHLQWETYFDWKKEDGLADHRAFYNWLLDQSPVTAGGDVDHLGDGSRLVFWPVQEDRAHQGKIEPTRAPAALEPDFKELEEERFPLYFQATRIISRSGDASQWWPWTKELEPENAVQIHPETAQALGIENGDEILVSGAVETMEGRAWISRMVPKWMVWSPRKLGERRVVVHKKGQTTREALTMLRELAP